MRFSYFARMGADGLTGFKIATPHRYPVMKTPIGRFNHFANQIHRCAAIDQFANSVNLALAKRLTARHLALKIGIYLHNGALPSQGDRRGFGSIGSIQNGVSLPPDQSGRNQKANPPQSSTS